MTDKIFKYSEFQLEKHCDTKENIPYFSSKSIELNQKLYNTF